LNNFQNHSFPIVLTIAGFDPSCGAGVGADLKTISAHNCYGVAAISATLLYALRRGDPDREPSAEASASLSWTPGGAVATVRGRF